MTIEKPTTQDVTTFGTKREGVGLGMPGNTPRRKRTAKPQRFTYDILQLLARGDLSKDLVTFGGTGPTDTVTIDARKERGILITISREFYDNYMRDYGHGSNILLRSKDSETGICSGSTGKDWR